MRRRRIPLPEVDPNDESEELDPALIVDAREQMDEAEAWTRTARLSRIILERILPQLDERRRILIEDLYAAHPRTLADLGRELGVSGERARQLRESAREFILRKLDEMGLLDPGEHPQPVKIDTPRDEANLSALDAFIRTFGRLPKNSTPDPHELYLWNWLRKRRHERKAEWSIGLSNESIVILKTLDKLDIRAKRGVPWNSKLARP